MTACSFEILESDLVWIMHAGRGEEVKTDANEAISQVDRRFRRGRPITCKHPSNVMSRGGVEVVNFSWFESP